MRRRANGEASVYQRRSNGKWIVAWTEPDGRRPTKTFAKDRAREAKSFHRELTDRLASGQAALDSRSRLADWGTHWVAEILPTAISPSGKPLAASTIGNYRSAMQARILRLADEDPRGLGSFTLDRLTAGAAQRWLNDLARSTSAAYAGTCFKVLKRCLDDARKDRLVAVNVMADVTMPRGKPRPKPVPKRTHVLELLERAPSPRLRALTATLGFTGCRISEALGLRWSDVDFDSGSLLIHGKGDKDRVVPMSPTLAAELRAWQREQRRERLASPWWGDGDWMLASEVGTHWDPHNARKLWRPLAEAVLPGITPHSLRHATATILLEDGVPAKLVSTLLGHASTRITLDLYSHVDLELLATATDTVERAIGIPGESR